MLQRAVRLDWCFTCSEMQCVDKQSQNETAQNGVHILPLRGGAEGVGPGLEKGLYLCPQGAGGALGPAGKLELAGLEAGWTEAPDCPWALCPARGEGLHSASTGRL